MFLEHSYPSNFSVITFSDLICANTFSDIKVVCLQFRLAYTSPLFNVVGAGELVDNPKKIALNYLKNYFFFDLLAASPLPQVYFFLSLHVVV